MLQDQYDMAILELGVARVGTRNWAYWNARVRLIEYLYRK